MNADGGLLEDTLEDLFENAPCGYLSSRLDGTITRVNQTFEDWTGHRREELLAGKRFEDLLSPGSRIYHETHFSPLLRMQGWVREIAVEIVRADGSRLPALVNAVLHADDAGHPVGFRTMVFDATERRRYEEELLRVRRREQDVALQLQRSLLAGSLPAAEGFEIEVAYRAAVSELEVGGDWYDAFWLEEGKTIGLVVGDVVGRGIAAAAAMGQLRSAVRALASVALSPARLLERLDAYAVRHEVGQMTTLVYAQLDLDSMRFRYACAGHPPPAIAIGGQQPEFAWEGRSLPLAAGWSGGEQRAEAECTLPRGSTVLLYTDGLIERREEVIDAGMERLRDEVADRRDTDAPLASAVLEALRDPDQPDDMCLLVVRV